MDSENNPNLPRELLTIIFTYLPATFIEELYYDKSTEKYWMGFPVRLDHNFWQNKALIDFNVTKDEFDNSQTKGYYRYAQIVSRKGLCRHSIDLIHPEIYLLRAVKQDNVDLFVKGINKLPSLTDIEDHVMNAVGPKVLTYLINNKMINFENMSRIYNSNKETIEIIGQEIDLDRDSVFYMRFKKKENIVSAIYYMPQIFTSLNITLMKRVLKRLSLNEISSILKYHNNSNLYDFVHHITCDDHKCNYAPKERLHTLRKMLFWAKAGRICCIISQIQTGNNSEIYLETILPFLSEHDMNNIMIHCDTTGFNALKLLLRYPNLLYQHKTWEEYRLDIDYSKELILEKDNLENYRKLLCIAKEINYDIPILDYSTEIIEME